MNRTLKILPEIANLLPPLSDSEMSGIESDIMQRGVISPLVVWNNVLVDGHHRYKVCKKHSLPFAVRELEFDSLQSAKLWAWQHQENRRNLTPFQRIEISLQFKPQIAEKAKKRQGKRNDLARTNIPATLPECREARTDLMDTNIGQNSARCSPQKTREELAAIAGVSHDTLAKAEYITEHADEDTKAKLRTGDTTINAEYKRLKREKRQQERKLQKQSEVSIPLDDRVLLTVSHIDEAIRHVEKESVDFIFTDPPYPKEYLHVYNDLARFAGHALKDGGSLLCMVGQSYLPEVLTRLHTELLHYHWTLAYLTPGGQAAQLWERKVNTFWKPVLWFIKGGKPSSWISDVVKSSVNDNDKQHHRWGQSESGMFDLMDRFVVPNQTICDPFLGGGTTGIAALKLKCRFIGLDADPETIVKSQGRFSTFLSELC
ncbi:MAG: hypothetical protein FWE67_16525 [Planctomycetaceae bacterium]|nr:hypothetical protein [Planctomycetaceae bacterium]